MTSLEGKAGTGEFIVADLPIVDESRIRNRKGRRDIYEFLSNLDRTFYPSSNVDFRPDFDNEDMLHIFPIDENQDLGSQMRYLPERTPDQIFRLRDFKIELVTREDVDRVINYRVFPNERGEQPLYKLIEVHSKKDSDVDKIIALEQEFNKEPFNPAPIYRAGSL